MIVLHPARGRSISLASLDLARAGRFCIEAPPQPLRIGRTTDALVTVGYATQARLATNCACGEDSVTPNFDAQQRPELRKIDDLLARRF